MTFPSSPTQGQQYTNGVGEVWTYKGSGWKKSTVTLQTITQNVTWLVGSDFSTLNAAVTALKSYFITSGVTITIQLPTGLSTLSAPLIGYKGPGSVKLKGATMTGAFPNASAFTVSGYDSTARGNDKGTNHTLCMSRFGSQIYAPNMNAISSDNNGNFDDIEDLYIYGDGTNGIGLRQSEGWATNLSQVVFGKFSRGIQVDQSGRVTCDANESAIFGCADNLWCFYGSIIANGITCIGGTNDGVNATNNSYVQVANSTIAGNGGNGITATDGAYIDASSAIFRKSSIGNGQHGIKSTTGSNVNAPGSTANGQASTSYYASYNGYINATGYLNTPTADPSFNTVGNNNACISG